MIKDKAAWEIARDKAREEDLRRSLCASAVPEHYHDGLIRYCVHHVPTGSFLDAALRNDLLEAVRRADPEGRKRIADIVLWLYDHAPGACWGNDDNVANWLLE